MFVPNDRRNKNNCSKNFIKLIAFYLTFKYNHSTDVPPINRENIMHFVPKYSEFAIIVQLFSSLISLENILNFVK